MHRLIGSSFWVSAPLVHDKQLVSPIFFASHHHIRSFLGPWDLHSLSFPRSGWQVQEQSEWAPQEPQRTYTSDKGHTHGGDNIHKTRRGPYRQMGLHTDGTTHGSDYTRMGHTNRWDYTRMGLHTDRAYTRMGLHTDGTIYGWSIQSTLGGHAQGEDAYIEGPYIWRRHIH